MKQSSVPYKTARDAERNQSLFPSELIYIGALREHDTAVLYLKEITI
jgi:hypothetical protein